MLFEGTLEDTKLTITNLKYLDKTHHLVIHPAFRSINRLLLHSETGEFMIKRPGQCIQTRLLYVCQ